MTSRTGRKSRQHESGAPITSRRASGRVQPTTVPEPLDVRQTNGTSAEPISIYPQPLSSLPTWIDNLHHAEQPAIAHTEALSASRAEEGEDMSWELRTETVGDAGEYREPSLAELQSSHARQLAHYKNLLIRAQSASSTALHELHTQLQQLQTAYDVLQAEHADCARTRRESQLDGEIADAMGSSDLEAKIRKTTRQERIRLLGIIADACNPSDVAAQIALLERYRRSRFDILGRLETKLAVSIMSKLSVSDILNVRLVSRRHRDTTHEPALWLELCKLAGEEIDDGRASAASPLHVSTDWESVYRGLYRREQNWREGCVQRVELLSGHTDYVTSLKLRGDTLISGSYAGTVRVWDIPRYLAVNDAVPSPVVIPSKSVSCLDYWPEKQVIATGFHDLGRLQIWRRTESGWQAGLLLSGHLHGIRAIAMNDQYLISAGADKAIVVWDYETGEKITRFGQQTNICVGIHLVRDMVISVTVDGVIRAFDIAKRQMVAQYRLSDLCKGVEGHAALKAANVLWVQGSGANLTCGTKSAIVHLQWEETVHAPVPIAQPRPTPVVGSPMGRKRHVSMGPTSPASPSSAVSPLRRPVGAIKTSTKRVSSLHLNSAPSPSSPSMSPRGPTLTPTRSGSAMTTASSATLVSPSPSRLTPKSALGSPTVRGAAVTTTERQPRSSEEKPRIVPRVSQAPKVVSIVMIPDVERGSIDEKTGRVVLSQRFAARLGADRNIYVVDREANERRIVPLRGAWSDAAVGMGLDSADKNPMSLVADRDRVIYGCNDGSIVLAHFRGL